MLPIYQRRRPGGSAEEGITADLPLLGELAVTCTGPDGILAGAPPPKEKPLEPSTPLITGAAKATGVFPRL